MEKYTHNIHESVRSNMQEFTGGECYEIDRRVNKGVTGTGEFNMCHVNVQDLVDRIGGERISCWLLEYVNETRSSIANGVYIWVWHSLWKTPEDEIVDVTQSTTYKNQKTGIFWLDNKRTTNLEEGIIYNSIGCVATGKARQRVKEYTKEHTGRGKTLVIGKLYWTLDLMHWLSLDEHSGEQRSVYWQQNRKLLEEKYKYKISDDGERGQFPGSEKELVKAKFDFLF